jgi:signal transduction histidine kinase
LEIVGKLAGGAAHEFNGILTVILGQGELLLSNRYRHGDERRSQSAPV